MLLGCLAFATMRALLAVIVLLAAPAPAWAVRLQKVGTFRQPVYVTGFKDTLLVAQRNGLIRAVRRGRARTFADLRARVVRPGRDEEVDQRGLFSIAVSRDGRRLYADYVDRAGHERVDWVGHRRLLDLGVVGLQHHGGQLQIGPDGRLYASTGIATGAGRILRLAPTQVYATGLRNPWRFSFAPDGSLIVGDVGDASQEEIDVLPPHAPPGADFGWPAAEGDLGSAPGSIAPQIVHAHADGWCAITGGYVWHGRYVYGDLCSGQLWSARFAAGALTDDRALGVAVGYLDSFGLDAHGRLYAVSFAGDVYRLLRGLTP
jgi:glucose/arabinose dehydrogenase